MSAVDTYTVIENIKGVLLLEPRTFFQIKVSHHHLVLIFGLWTLHCFIVDKWHCVLMHDAVQS